MNEVISNSAILFASTFVTVMVIGFQSQIVRLGHKIPAFFLSLTLGTAQIFSFKLVPNAGTIELICFVLGGACGIVSSIYLHDFYLKIRNIKDSSRES